MRKYCSKLTLKIEIIFALLFPPFVKILKSLNYMSQGRKWRVCMVPVFGRIEGAAAHPVLGSHLRP